MLTTQFPERKPANTAQIGALRVVRHGIGKRLQFFIFWPASNSSTRSRWPDFRIQAPGFFSPAVRRLRVATRSSRISKGLFFGPSKLLLSLPFRSVDVLTYSDQLYRLLGIVKDPLPLAAEHSNLSIGAYDTLLQKSKGMPVPKACSIVCLVALRSSG